MYRYSPSTRGFYPASHPPAAVPADTLAIEDTTYSLLLEAQAQGAEIVPGVGGYPTAVSPPAPDPIIALRAQRQAAYRRESDPLYFAWQRNEASEEDWLAAVAAIRARFPYPEESPV